MDISINRPESSAGEMLYLNSTSSCSVIVVHVSHRIIMVASIHLSSSHTVRERHLKRRRRISAVILSKKFDIMWINQALWAKTCDKSVGCRCIDAWVYTIDLCSSSHFMIFRIKPCTLLVRVPFLINQWSNFMAMTVCVHDSLQTIPPWIGSSSHQSST